jgi:hypothetical protein
VSDLQQAQKRNSDLSDSKSPAVPPLPILLIVSCSAAWVVGQLSYNTLPQLLAPIKVAFDRSDEVVTRMYGYELFVYAIVVLAAAGPLARFSRVLVALLGGAVAVAACIMSALTDSYSVLVVCRIMLGLMARLDDLGRWAVAFDAMWWLGDAASPPVAGMIVERSGFELLATFPVCTGVIGITLFMRVLRRFGSNRKASVT